MDNENILSDIISNPQIISHMCGFVDATPLHGEWIKDTWYNREDNSHQAFRGARKTTNVVIAGIILNLLFYPEDRIFIFRETFSTASLVLKLVSSIMRGNPKIRGLFKLAHGEIPTLLVDSDSELRFSFKKKDTLEGNLHAFGIDKSPTGFHCDVAILDDIVSVKDRYSQAKRKKTKEIVREIRTNVVDPGGFCIFNGTPWHPEDAWTILPEPKKYNVDYAIQCGLNKEWIEKRRSLTSVSLWGINYLLKHIQGEDTIIKHMDFGEWKYNVPVIGHVDAKYSGTDTGAFTMITKKPLEDGYYRAIGFMFTDNIQDCYPKIVQQWRKYGCGTVFKEKNDDKGYTARLLKGEGIYVSSYHESENKHIKIINNIIPFHGKVKWANETDNAYIEQLTAYEEGYSPDDCIDSYASLIRQGKFMRKGMSAPSISVGL